MYPQIHFNYLEPATWLGRSTKELRLEMEALRRQIKDAVGYQWDSTHFYIDNIYGRPALQIDFYDREEAIPAWNALNGRAIHMPAAPEGIITKEIVKALSEAQHKVTEGFTQCNVCYEWISAEAMNPFSFAGAVCDGCYDPKRHLPPDTRGD